MYKDVFVLKKDAWHSKLMTYIWNLKYRDFSHMCPYFWLSIFNVIIIPILFPIKIVIKTINNLLGNFFSWLEDIREKRFNALLERMSTDDEFFEKIMKNKKYQKKNFLGSIGYKYDELYDKILLKLQLISIEKTEKYKVVYRKDIKEPNKFINKDRINNLLKIIKPIMTWFFYILGVALGLLLLFGGWRLGIAASHWNWHNIGLGLLVMLKYLGIIAAIIGLMIALGFMFSYLDRESKIKDFLNKVIRIIEYPVIQIAKFIVLLIQMFKNNCPAIKWE